MRLPMQDHTRRGWREATWSPLLVLGLSVIASVVLISACMAMLSPEAEAGPLRVSQAASARSAP